MRRRIAREEPIMTEVTVKWDGKTVQVTPDGPTQLFYDYPKGPHEVAWKLSASPKPPQAPTRESYRLKIAWEYDAPFSRVAPPAEGVTDEVHATGNTRREGEYGYSVLIVDEKDQVVAGVDPRIANNPKPPR